MFRVFSGYVCAFMTAITWIASVSAAMVDPSLWQVAPPLFYSICLAAFNWPKARWLTVAALVVAAILVAATAFWILKTHAYTAAFPTPKVFVLAFLAPAIVVAGLIDQVVQAWREKGDKSARGVVV
jgi:hypothetical protein